MIGFLVCVSGQLLWLGGQHSGHSQEDESQFAGTVGVLGVDGCPPGRLEEEEDVSVGGGGVGGVELDELDE